MACTLAESPSDPFHRKLRQLRCLRCRFDCYRMERTSSRAGVSPAEVQRLFTAHFFANNESKWHRCGAISRLVSSVDLNPLRHSSQEVDGKYSSGECVAVIPAVRNGWIRRKVFLSGHVTADRSCGCSDLVTLLIAA